MDKVRLQVYLSHNGVCSRRKAMDIIQQGDVKVNGTIVREPSFPVDASKDKVTVDGKGVRAKDYLYVLLYKKQGFVTTKSDRFASQTVYQLLPKKWRHLAPVGRLDKDTEGLLLMTNDGDVAFKLTHPKFRLDKTYYVIVDGMVDLKTKKRIERGIILDGRKTAPAKVMYLKSGRRQSSFQLTLHEGRKRQIRLMCQRLGHRVQYLKRLRQGPLTLGNLKPGETRLLKKSEVEKLKNL